MATYVPIVDAEVAAEQPVTVSLMTRLRDNILSYLGAPSTTVMLFRQTLSPLGWTKSTANTDKAIRVTSGTLADGGVLAFSTAFGRVVTDGRVLVVGELPTHTPSGSVSQPSITTTIRSVTVGVGGVNIAVATAPPNNDAQTTTIDTASTPTFTGAPIGVNNAHEHGMDIRVQYLDVIIATKD